MSVDVLPSETSVMPVANPAADLPAPPGRISRVARIANLIAVIVPFAALVLAIGSLWGRGVPWLDLWLMAGLYVATVLGITVGFHRLFTHRSFETTRAVRLVLGLLGAMAVQGRLFKWVALHRRHHQHSDDVRDPHSPHHYGRDVWSIPRGMWHSHVGWIFDPDPPELEHYVRDLEQDNTLRVVDKLFFAWVTLGLVTPAAIGGIVFRTWNGAFWAFVWGGLVRVLLVHHVTWSINFVCHLWGRRPYESGDESRSNCLFGLLALGEGWHNTHHAFPTSSRHGLQWWQPDVSYWVIRTLAAVGLAWDLKLPTMRARQKKRVHPDRPPADECDGKEMRV